eukprot:scaffold742_cov165-Amphora_coffeaeformis.AAC.18
MPCQLVWNGSKGITSKRVSSISPTTCGLSILQRLRIIGSENKHIFPSHMFKSRPSFMPKVRSSSPWWVVSYSRGSRQVRPNVRKNPPELKRRNSIGVTWFDIAHQRQL